MNNYSTQYDRVLAFIMITLYVGGLLALLILEVGDSLITYYLVAGTLVVTPLASYLTSRTKAWDIIKDKMETIEHQTNGRLDAKFQEMRDHIANFTNKNGDTE